MCGIIAGISVNCYIKLLQSLYQLQNRGYDSAGITTIVQNQFLTHKYASTSTKNALEELNQHNHLHKSSMIGIGHTRWATHGPKTDENSHPHASSDGKIMVVHNGIIENYQVLKIMLEDKGYTFQSQTDTEVISNLIAYYYVSYYEEGNTEFECRIYMQRALERVVQTLEGSWGIVVMNIDTPNTLYCTRLGSPLLVGKTGPKVFVTSEQSGFNNELSKYMILNNYDICTIFKSGTEVSIKTKDKYSMRKILQSQKAYSKEPYPHWTIKEIHEQVDSTIRATKLGSRVMNNSCVKLDGLDRNKETLNQVEHLILLGCGTSYHSGLLVIKTMKQLGLFTTIQLFDGADFTKEDIPITGKVAAIFISQSGETKDLHRCIDIAKANNVFTIGVVNVVDSLIAREVDCGCYLHAGREVAVASTKAFSSQVIILTMIAVWFAQEKNIHLEIRKQILKDLQCLHEDIQKTIEYTDKHLSDILPLFHGPSCFILGKDKAEAVAKEGALKIKEISYIHAEGYSTSSLKHGPFALLKEEFPVIMLGIDNQWYAKTENAYEEIKSRHASIIFITDKPNQNKPHVLYIPKNNSFSDLLAIIPMQLLAYHLSVRNGVNPDMPRNLAKVVTVE